MRDAGPLTLLRAAIHQTISPRFRLNSSKSDHSARLAVLDRNHWSGGGSSKACAGASWPSIATGNQRPRRRRTPSAAPASARAGPAPASRIRSGRVSDSSRCRKGRHACISASFGARLPGGRQGTRCVSSTPDRSKPMLASTWLSIRPGAPAKASPVRSSSDPGASAMRIKPALGFPDGRTVCVAVARSGHPSKPSMARCSASSVAAEAASVCAACAAPRAAPGAGCDVTIRAVGAAATPGRRMPGVSCIGRVADAKWSAASSASASSAPHSINSRSAVRASLTG